MILTAKDKGKTIFSIDEGRIHQVSNDWKEIVGLWLSRGFRYVSLRYELIICKPNSKTFLTDLQTFIKLNFPDFDTQITEQ